MASTHAHSGDDDDVAIVSTSTPEERKQYKDKNPVAGAWGPFTPRKQSDAKALV